MARNITHLTLSSLTLTIAALSFTGCGGRDLTLGTRDDGVNLNDENGMEPDADGVSEMGTGTGSGMVAVAGASSTGTATVSEPGTMRPVGVEDSSSSGGGAPAMSMGIPVAGAGPCTEIVGGVAAHVNEDGEVVARGIGLSVSMDGDGTTTVYHRDGSMTVIAPDGTETTTQDAMIATADDGVQTLYFSDGTIVTLLADESVVAVGETWSVEGGPNGSSGAALSPMEVPCSGTSGGGMMDVSMGVAGGAAVNTGFRAMCSANGDGTYSYREADGTVTTVSRPEPLPDGSISMEEVSSPCADLWASEDADETGSGGTAVGGAAAEMEPVPEE